jgi:hypothetical protein
VRWPSFFVAALFAVHPLHVESVAWVSERKDLLSTFFGLAALWAYARYARTPSWRGMALVVVAFALSLLAKPMFVTLPCLLLLLDGWPLGRYRGGPVAAAAPTRSSTVLIIEKLPLFALAAASCVVTCVAQAAGGAVAPIERLPLFERFANAVHSYSAYLVDACWPVNLAVFYPFPVAILQSDPKGPDWLLSLLFISILTMLLFRFSRRHPYLMIGWLWYLGTLVPVLGLVQVGYQARADRYTYFPLTGVFVAVVWWLSAVVPVRARPLLVGVGVIALGWFAVITSAQLGFWKDSLTLWTRDVDVVGPNAIACSNLGAAWFERGDLEKAEADYVQTLAINPNDVIGNVNLAVVRHRQGRVDDALHLFETALHVDPHCGFAYVQLGQ